METALLLVVAMIFSAPLIGYLRATAWAAERGLARKEAPEGEPAAMSLH